MWRKERMRSEAWSQTDELLAYGIETNSLWMRIMAQLHNPKDPSKLPEVERISRPDWLRPEREEPKAESDPRKIAAWFQNNLGN